MAFWDRQNCFVCSRRANTRTGVTRLADGRRVHPDCLVRHIAYFNAIRYRMGLRVNGHA